MRAEVVANLMVEKLSTSLVYANFLHSYNDVLVNMASEHHIELPKGYNLISLAITAAHEAGAKDMAEEVALDAINHAVFKEKTEDELEYSHKYVQYTIIPNLVYGLKAKGQTIDEIHKNNFVKDLIHKYNIKESYLDKVFKEEKKAIKPVVTMMERKHVSDNIFEKYTPTRGNFTRFWFSTIKNHCRDILEKIHNADRLLHDALRIHSTDHRETNHEFGSGHNYVIHDIKQEEEILSKSEAKNLKKKLIDFLKKKNPKYENALKLISDGKDIFSNIDKHVFEKDLELNNHEFEKFKTYFFKDLKQALHHLDVSNTDEGLAILKSAKIAKSILAKIIKQ